MPSILLIEDDEYLRATLAQTLSEHGYAVTQAVDGAEGLKLFRSNPADLVITDIVMPNKDGLEAIAELHRYYPNIGVIAMSGGGMIRNPQGYLQVAGLLGANRTLNKPFSADTLLTAVSEVLKAVSVKKPAFEIGKQ